MKFPPLTEAFVMRDMVHPSKRRHCWWNGNGKHFFSRGERMVWARPEIQVQMATKIRASRIRE